MGEGGKRARDSAERWGTARGSVLASRAAGLGGRGRAGGRTGGGRVVGPLLYRGRAGVVWGGVFSAGSLRPVAGQRGVDGRRVGWDGDGSRLDLDVDVSGACLSARGRGSGAIRIVLSVRDAGWLLLSRDSFCCQLSEGVSWKLYIARSGPRSVFARMPDRKKKSLMFRVWTEALFTSTRKLKNFSKFLITSNL